MKWKPTIKVSGETDKEIIKIVNECVKDWTELSRRPAQNRDYIIHSLGFDVLQLKKREDRNDKILNDIWDSYINLMKENPMTEEETKGNGNYEKRLFDNFYKKIGDTISNRWNIM